jgi:hypothetical protein
MFIAETYPFSRKLPGKRKFSRNKISEKFAHFRIIFVFCKNGKNHFVSTLVDWAYKPSTCAPHVLSTAPPFILWWSNLEILFAPLHRSSPFIGGLRCQAIQMEHGPYIAERTQKAVYILRWRDTETDRYREKRRYLVPISSIHPYMVCLGDRETDRYRDDI